MGPWATTPCCELCPNRFSWLMKAKKTKTFNLPPRPPLCQLKKPLHMLYNVSMLKCGDNRLCCAGKRPPPRYSFSPLCAPHPACGESHNHSLFFPFSPREGWSDGAYAAASLSHAMQLICNLSPLFSSSSDSYPLLLFSFFLSCPCLHKTTPTRTNAPRP